MFPMTPGANNGPGATGGIDPQAELARARQELENFTYSVSHDMKGPLHTIKGFIEIVMEDMQAGRQQTLWEDLVRIRDAANVLQSQLDCMLKLSRLGRQTPSRTRLPVQSICEELRRAWEHSFSREGAELSFELAHGWVDADPVLLHEMLGYLLQNALSFRVRERPLRVGVRFHATSSGVGISISDNGRGVPEEHLESIFMLFRKLDPLMPGLGAGLAYARRIAVLHGGRLWAQRAGGEGGLILHLDLPSEPATEEASQ